MYHLGPDLSGEYMALAIDISTNAFIQCHDDGSGFVQALVTGAFNDTNWHHVVATWDVSANEISLVIDDGTPATGTGVNLTGSTRTTGGHALGAGYNSGYGFWLDGTVVEVARWDRKLTDDEITALSKNYAPTFFPESLVWYIPCIREYEERRVPLSVTNNGSSVVDHLEMIYPTYVGLTAVTAFTDHVATINDGLVFGGSGTLNIGHVATVSDGLVYGGSGTLNKAHAASITDSLVFGGSGSLSRPHIATINDGLVFGGSGAINKNFIATITDSLVFPGTGLIGRGHVATVSDSLVFGGSGTTGKLWTNTSDTEETTSIWTDTPDTEEASNTWSDTEHDEDTLSWSDTE